MFLKDYIKVYPKVISLENASVLIRLSSKMFFKKAGISEKNIINEKIRNVNSYQLDPLDKSLSITHWARFLNFKIKNLMNNYLVDTKSMSFYNQINTVDQIEMLKYEKTFHYNFHVDDGPHFKRTLSCILFLNNDYDGGQLTFKDLKEEEEFTIENIPGSAIVWPSNFLYPHTVKPVEKGVRYSIVAWGH